jgi:hypothetical protein
MENAGKDRRINMWIAFFAVLKLAIHFATNTVYGLHRDAFLYLEESKHLQWGFVEVPPLTPFIAKLPLWLGGSTFVIRLFPALAGAATVLLAGMLVRRLGGGTWAVAIACSALIISPILLFCNTLFQPVSFNQLFWFMLAYAFIRLVQTGDHRYWYGIGVISGIGMLNKYSIGFYILALAAALLLSSHRKWYATRHPYFASLLALLIFLPNIIWQFQHELPVIHHLTALQENQLAHVTLADYILPFFWFHMGTIVIWTAALIALAVYKPFRAYRFIATAWLIAVVLVGIMGGRTYYVIGAFTVLLVFGGLLAERIIRPAWGKAVLLAVCILIVAPFMPHSIPMLQVDKYRQYTAVMAEKYGFSGILKDEDGIYQELPQNMADMFGWEEMAGKVYRHYHALPDSVRDGCLIYGESYGHAGAINHYNRNTDLPEAVSMNSSFVLWFPERTDIDNILVVAGSKRDSSQWFQKVALLDSNSNPFARDPGYIYHYTDPKDLFQEEIGPWIRENKARHGLRMTD